MKHSSNISLCDYKCQNDSVNLGSNYTERSMCMLNQSMLWQYMLENNSNSTLADPKYFHKLLHALNMYRGRCHGTESWSFKAAPRNMYGNITENKANTVSSTLTQKDSEVVDRLYRDLLTSPRNATTARAQKHQAFQVSNMTQRILLWMKIKEGRA